MDIIGKRFGRLIVRSTKRKGDYPSSSYYLCKCDCGSSAVVLGSELTRRNRSTRSCGCLSKEISTAHGMARHTLYGTWFQMNSRCYNPEHHAYKNYGGRHIQVCYEWRSGVYGGPANGLKNYVEYIERHLGPKPSPKHTVDRVDNDDIYKPGNLQWATRRQQRLNQRQFEKRAA